MRQYLPIVLILTFYNATGQTSCGCESELDFVVDFVEANVPSFKDNVDTTNQDTYQALKAKVYADAKAASNKVECLKTLTYYVEFFRDNHTSLYFFSEDVDERNAASVEDFLTTEAYRLTEMFVLDDSATQQYPLEDIRGVYQSQDARHTIAVVPDQGPYRDYVGVVVSSESPLWKPNQVRLELKRAEDGRWEVFAYQDDHSLGFYRDYPFINGILGDTWFKMGLDEKINPVTNVVDSLAFDKLNDSTAYLRLPLFYTSQIKRIDSLVIAVDDTIKRTPYLIIDVRNNGGGSDMNALRLLDYIYTKPIRKDRVELYATAGNIKKYEDNYKAAQQDTANYGEGYLTWVKNTIQRMKAAPPNSYLLLSDDDQFVVSDSVFTYPKKVAVLYNKYCASSCESLLFLAMNSDKTLLVGEPSGGYVGYGEALRTYTPCYGFAFNGSTTRYRRRRQYEVIGIPPDYQLDYDSDWIEETVALLAKEGSTN